MKKLLALVLALALIVCAFAALAEGVMTHDDYVAAELETSPDGTPVSVTVQSEEEGYALLPARGGGRNGSLRRQGRRVPHLLRQRLLDELRPRATHLDGGGSAPDLQLEEIRVQPDLHHRQQPPKRYYHKTPAYAVPYHK